MIKNVLQHIVSLTKRLSKYRIRLFFAVFFGLVFAWSFSATYSKAQKAKDFQLLSRVHMKSLDLFSEFLSYGECRVRFDQSEKIKEVGFLHDSIGAGSNLNLDMLYRHDDVEISMLTFSSFFSEKEPPSNLYSHGLFIRTSESTKCFGFLY